MNLKSGKARTNRFKTHTTFKIYILINIRERKGEGEVYINIIEQQ